MQLGSHGSGQEGSTTCRQACGDTIRTRVKTHSTTHSQDACADAIHCAPAVSTLAAATGSIQTEHSDDSEPAGEWWRALHDDTDNSGTA